MARKVVFDLGMHQGEDTAFYLTAGYDVVAFEANPDLVEFCSRRFAPELQRDAPGYWRSFFNKTGPEAQRGREPINSFCKSSLSIKARRTSGNAALPDMLRKEGELRDLSVRSLRGYIADALLAGSRHVSRGSGGPVASVMRNGQHANRRLAARASDASADAGATARSLRKHIRGSIISIAALLGGVGGWAATAEFSGAVIVPGTLVVDGSIKKLQHPTGGVLSEVLVKEGDHVAAGDVLIRLDHVQASVNLQIVAKNLNELLVRRVRLEAENLGAQKLEFPIDLGARALDDPELGRVIAGERSLFDARSDSRHGQRSQLKERIRQLNGQTSGLEEQIVAKKKEMQLIARELAGVHELYIKA